MGGLGTRGTRAAAATLLALLLLAPAARADAPDELRFVAVDTSDRPFVDLVVAAPPSLSTRTLPRDSVTVMEEGRVRPATIDRLADDDLAVAVVVDPSLPEDDLAAARGAAANLLLALPSGVRTAVVAGGGGLSVTSPASDDPAAAIAAIDDLDPATPSQLRDGVTRGLTSVAETDATRLAVVVVGGAEVDQSVTRPAWLTEATERTGATVYSVATATSGDAEWLASLAEASGGIAATADTGDDLVGALDAVSADLLEQYRVRYQTPARGPVEVSVTVRDGSVVARGTTTVGLPPEPVADAPPPGPEQVAPPAAEPPRDRTLWPLVAIVVLVLGLTSLLLLRGRRRSVAHGFGPELDGGGPEPVPAADVGGVPADRPRMTTDTTTAPEADAAAASGLPVTDPSASSGPARTAEDAPPSRRRALRYPTIPAAAPALRARITRSATAPPTGVDDDAAPLPQEAPPTSVDDDAAPHSREAPPTSVDDDAAPPPQEAPPAEPAALHDDALDDTARDDTARVREAAAGHDDALHDIAPVPVPPPVSRGGRRRRRAGAIAVAATSTLPAPPGSSRPTHPADDVATDTAPDPVSRDAPELVPPPPPPARRPSRRLAAPAASTLPAPPPAHRDGSPQADTSSRADASSQADGFRQADASPQADSSRQADASPPATQEPAPRSPAEAGQRTRPARRTTAPPARPAGPSTARPAGPTGPPPPPDLGEVLGRVARRLRRGASLSDALTAVAAGLPRRRARAARSAAAAAAAGAAPTAALGHLVRRRDRPERRWLDAALGSSAPTTTSVALAARIVGERARVRREGRWLALEAAVAAVGLSLLPIVAALVRELLVPGSLEAALATTDGTVLLGIASVLTLVAAAWLVRLSRPPYSAFPRRWREHRVVAAREQALLDLLDRAAIDLAAGAAPAAAPTATSHDDEAVARAYTAAIARADAAGDPLTALLDQATRLRTGGLRRGAAQAARVSIAALVPFLACVLPATVIVAFI